MRSWIGRLASPGGAVAVALCLAAPWLCDRFHPAIEGDPLVVLMTPMRDADAAWAQGAIEVTERSSVAAGSGRVTTMRFDLERGGRFSVYGRSGQPYAEPVDVWINGRHVSSVAFYPQTAYDETVAQLLARGVPIAPGPNELVIESERLAGRTMALELRREAPPGLWRYALLCALTALALAARAAVVRRVRLGPRLRLMIALPAYAAIVFGALPAAVWRASGGHIGDLGEVHPDRAAQLAAFERQVASPQHAEALRDRYAVAVLGDSTQIYGLQDDTRMLSTLVRLTRSESDAPYWFGAASGAFNAMDYYLLANRIADDPPDLIVVPVNLRSFGPAWLENPGFRAHDLDHYLRPSELLRHPDLSAGGREIGPASWLLRRADAAWLDRRVARALRGARLFTERERERLLAEANDRLRVAWAVPRDPASARARSRRPVWQPEIGADHELIAIFRALDGLAARSGFEILYYTVVPNLAALAREGVKVNAWENFARIERAIGRAPGVHFLMLRDGIPEAYYRDELDHPLPPGIKLVARRIADEVAAIRGKRGPR